MLDRSPPRPDSDLNFVFTFAHACASAADELDLRLSVTPPPGHKQIETKEPPYVHFDCGVALVEMPLRIHTAGEWSFQLISTFGGTERPVGEAQRLTFTSEGLRARLEKWAWWLGGGLAIVLALANAAMFLFARRSAWHPEKSLSDNNG